MITKEAWELELLSRQDNIDPIRRIPNAAYFQGTLINGSLKLNRAQQAGAILVGLSSLAAGIFMCVPVVEVVISEFSLLLLPGLLIGLPFGTFAVWAGWKIIWNACINHPEPTRASSHESRT